MRNMPPTRKLLFAGLLAVSPLSQAHAYTIYTNRIAWEAALSTAPIVTDTFSNSIASAQSITLDSGIVSTNSIPPILPNPPFNNSVSDGAYHNATQAGAGNSASNTITWVFPFYQTAFGADFTSTNSNGLTLIGNFDGTGDQTIIVNNTIGGEDGFLGVVGGAPFDSIILSNASTILDEFSIDNASLGTIPVPGTLALLGVGLAGLAAARRRRR